MVAVGDEESWIGSGELERLAAAELNGRNMVKSAQLLGETILWSTAKLP